jgi:hypothetical protein
MWHYDVACAMQKLSPDFKIERASPGATREWLILKCLSCGESHQYSPSDLVKATEPSLSNKKK